MSIKTDFCDVDFLKQLDFSDIEKQVSSLKASLFDQSDETHQLKLQLIKEALATHQYDINATTIATRLLEASPVIEVSEYV